MVEEWCRDDCGVTDDWALIFPSENGSTNLDSIWQVVSDLRLPASCVSPLERLLCSVDYALRKHGFMPIGVYDDYP